MYSDNEKDDEEVDTRNIELKVKQFCEQSTFYLNQLPSLKKQLNEINQFNEFDLYVQKLNQIGNIVQNLSQHIGNIEELHLKLTNKARLKLDRQIQLVRKDIDHERLEFHRLREQAMTTSMNENPSSMDDNNHNNNNAEEDSESNQLRQRHLTETNNLAETCDSLQQDVVNLHQTIQEVALLVAQHKEKLTHTEQLINTAHDRIQNASTLLQKAVHNKYTSMISGALLGASLGGPVGLVMGLKIGAVVALSGSAVGAVSVNLAQQRRTRSDTPTSNDTSYNQAML